MIRRRRLFTIILLLGLLAVGSAVIWVGPRLLVRRLQLSWQPQLLVEFLAAPVGSAKKVAASDFVQRPEGTRAFVSIVASDLFERSGDWKLARLAPPTSKLEEIPDDLSDRDVCIFHLYTQPEQICVTVDYSSLYGGSDGLGIGTQTVADRLSGNLHIVRSFLELFGSQDGSSLPLAVYELQSYPDFSFTLHVSDSSIHIEFVRKELALLRRLLSANDSSRRRIIERLIRRESERAIPLLLRAPLGADGEDPAGDAVVRLCSRRAIPILVAALGGHPTLRELEVALSAKVPWEYPLTGLGDLLTREDEELVLRRATRTLIALGDEAVPALVGARSEATAKAKARIDKILTSVESRRGT